MRLSILTVVRNDRAGLLATRDSLRVQTAGGWEWVVVDGASDDGTAQWLAAHGTETAWWRSAPDGGIFAAMNIALEQARGDWLLFLNAGDRLAGSDTLARLMAAMEAAAPATGLIYGDALERLADGRCLLKPARSHRWAALGMFTHHQAMLYRRSVVGEARFESRFRVAADYAFTLRVLERGAPPLRLGFPVCIFASGGLSQREAARGRQELRIIRRETLGMGWAASAAVTALHNTTAIVRRHFPALYAKGRFRMVATTFRL